ncbi:hypothetical protein BC938DRAFT_481828 [Jimgerdemannia flammicorona]|uniref:Uncharacterized protein n=1 Tax=Jimgerdemannia flammicorona TaxID=994334 RepID=A0A433QFC5_9FUNG|nr:hypothetical protein BC938DRAFT_481828 [Jimgerdemannia flammicorona]
MSIAYCSVSPNNPKCLHDAFCASPLLPRHSRNCGNFIKHSPHGIAKSIVKCHRELRDKLDFGLFISDLPKLNRVVNQVLTYAKMEHGKMSLENSTFDLIHLLQEIGDGTFFLYITTYLLNDIVPDP